MMNVLLASEAAHPRHVGGTLTSAVVHGALIAAAVAVTVRDPARPHVTPIETITTVFRPTPSAPAAPTSTPVEPAVRSIDAVPREPTIQFADPKGPVVDVTPSISTPSGATEIGAGVSQAGPISAPPGLSGPPGGIVDEHLVDRAPRLLGRAEPPVYPSALRATGKSGRVVVQFVVDTTGRAEMSEFRAIETNDPLFVDAVRAALPRYRFSPGEAGGRKVRTLVQLPFDFTLVK